MYSGCATLISDGTHPTISDGTHTTLISDANTNLVVDDKKAPDLAVGIPAV